MRPSSGSIDERLVGEAAEALIGLRVAVGRLVVRVDLEDVAVRLAARPSSVSSQVSHVPHGVRPPAQLSCGAGQADVLADRLPSRVDLDGGGAAAGLRRNTARRVRDDRLVVGGELVVPPSRGAVSRSAPRSCSGSRRAGRARPSGPSPGGRSRRRPSAGRGWRTRCRTARSRRLRAARRRRRRRSASGRRGARSRRDRSGRGRAGAMRRSSILRALGCRGRNAPLTPREPAW